MTYPTHSGNLISMTTTYALIAITLMIMAALTGYGYVA